MCGCVLVISLVAQPNHHLLYLVRIVEHPLMYWSMCLVVLLLVVLEEVM